MTNSDTILIIDDEVQIRRLLEITLSAHGYKISEASTGKEGWCMPPPPTLYSLSSTWAYLMQMELRSSKTQGVVFEANPDTFRSQFRG